MAHKIPINTKTAFLEVLEHGAFDVLDHFYLKKLWKVKFLTFEGEVLLHALPGFRQTSLRNFEPYAWCMKKPNIFQGI